MDESTNQRGLNKHKKIIALFIILLVGPPLAVYTINEAYIMYLVNNPELGPFYEASYNLTVWIAPENEEFFLYLDFYGSEQNAYSKINRYEGHGFRVEPLDEEENNGRLRAVPPNMVSVWVRIYFDQETQEPFVIHRIDLYQQITTSLQDREISILMEP